MTKEFRVYGPPGTGKTTWLSRQVERAVEKFGNGSVVVVSFTKAAAREVAGRKVPLPKENVGTLHAICYRALGNPVIAESRIGEFNSFSRYKVSGARVSLDDPSLSEASEGAKEDDRALMEMSRLRGLCVQRDMWPLSVQSFAKEWDRWKEKTGYLDFTDLLEKAFERFPTCPGNPDVLFVDEAQDLNPLMVRLVRKWGARTEQFILVGDDDQAIYEFIGADPSAFLAVELPEDHIKVLSQSYRVPRAVHSWGEQWIRRVTSRASKDYLPRECDGVLEHLGGVGYKSPERILEHATGAIDEGKSVMVLTTCGYQLNSMLALLKKEGIPFHNPFSNNGGWNPLRASRGVGVTERLVSFLRPDPWLWPEPRGSWTWTDLATWTPLVYADKAGFIRGTKKMVTEWSANLPYGRPRMDEIFPEGSPIPDLLQGDDLDRKIEWLRDVARPEALEKLEYPLRILEKEGGVGLETPPQIIVGTIHSVKGGQADRVYVCPDLSMAGYREWMKDGRGRDAILRQFYVAATRAREDLYFCAPATSYFVDTGR